MTHDINIKKWKVLLFLFWSLTFDWYQHVTSSSWNLSKFRNHNSHRLTWMCSNREKNRFIFNEWIVFLQEMMILWFLFWPSLQSLFCHPLEQLQTYDPRVFIHVPLFKHGNKSHSSRSTEKEKRMVVKVQLLFLIQMGLKFSFIQKKEIYRFHNRVPANLPCNHNNMIRCYSHKFHCFGTENVHHTHLYLWKNQQSNYNLKITIALVKEKRLE